MKTFTLIRSYSCRKSLGFVYELDGKRCASLARSLSALTDALGVRSMPALEGSEKQIRWATNLRQQRVTLWATAARDLAALKAAWPEMHEAMAHVVARNEQLRRDLSDNAAASFWIDQRSDAQLAGLAAALGTISTCARRGADDLTTAEMATIAKGEARIAVKIAA